MTFEEWLRIPFNDLSSIPDGDEVEEMTLEEFQEWLMRKKEESYGIIFDS